jgi:hypothetical protein
VSVTVARLQAVLGADTRDFDKGMGKSESRMKSVGKSAGIAGAAVAGGITLALKSTIGPAKDAELAQLRMEQALRSANVSYGKHGDAIEAAIQKTSRLAALDDEDLSNAFSKLVRTTGDVTKATEGMNLAADIARARGVSLEAATKAVERTFAGSTAGLKRFGIVVKESNTHALDLKHQIEALREGMQGQTGAVKEATEAKIKDLQASMKNARELDKMATATSAIEMAQKKFAGSAEDYGKSSAAASERFGVALENLQERIGSAILPALTKLTVWGTEFLYWSEKNWPRFQQIVSAAFEKVKPTIQTVIDTATVLKDTVAKHWGTIERNMLALKTVVENTLKNVRDAIELVNALLHGDWNLAWENAKAIVTRTIDSIKTLLTNSVQNILQLAGALGRAVWNGFRDGITGIGEFFLGVVTGLKDMLVNQLENMRQKAVDLGSAIKNGIVSGVTGLGLAIWELVKAVPEWLIEQIGKVPELFKGIGSAIKDMIVDGAKGIGQSIWENVKDEIKDLPGRVAGAFGKGDGGGVSDAGGGGNFTSAGVPNLMGASAVMGPFAAAASRFGLVVTSGLRPGAITANGTPSDHGYGKALDVSNGVNTPEMAAFFRSLIGNPSVKQAFYDPIGSIFGGKLSSYREGGHSDHVHVATYDKGGYLKPGWNLAYNGLGRPEPVGFGGNTTINVYGSMIHERDLDARIREGVLREQNRGRGI